MTYAPEHLVGPWSAAPPPAPPAAEAPAGPLAVPVPLAHESPEASLRRLSADGGTAGFAEAPAAPPAGDLWVPGAERVQGPKSGGSYLDAPWRFVFHTIEGEPSADGFRGLVAGHTNPPHLWAMPSADLLLQTIPLNKSAYALARPGSIQTNRLHAVQVELWGFAAKMGQVSPEVLDWLARRVLAPVARLVPIDLTVARKPTLGEQCYGKTSPCRMSAQDWQAFTGVCGHKDVPDNDHWDPGNLDMPGIAARARAIVAPAPAPAPAAPSWWGLPDYVKRVFGGESLHDGPDFAAEREDEDHGPGGYETGYPMGYETETGYATTGFAPGGYEDEAGEYELPGFEGELEKVGTEAETRGSAFESASGETDPEFEDSEAAVDAVFGAPGSEAEGAFGEPEAEDLAGEEPETVAKGHPIGEPEEVGTAVMARPASAGGMEANLEQRELPSIDKRQTTSWAIASLGGGGFIVGYSVFLLVNRETGREHQIHIPTGGLSTYFGVASASSVSYTTFETRRAVSFADFDGIGVRLTTANIGVFFGYSIVYLTLWDGPAYVSDRLAYIKMSGWGAMIPGGAVAHGVTKIAYGSGTRSGVVPLVIAPQPDDTVREPAMASIRLAAKESPRIALPNEMLFAFDSTEIKPAAHTALLYIADLLNNRMRLPVAVEGHTDSTGSSKYNLALSTRRAEAVKRWFVDRGVHGASDFRVIPYGEAKPVATNSTAEGRRKNRRVVINASWGL